MNKLAACLALAIAPTLLSAAEKPDGLLGVDYVGLSGVYVNISSEDVDVDYNGIAASFNKNLFRSDSGVGFDLGTTLLYSRNINMREVFDTNSTQGTLDLTLFQDGLAKIIAVEPAAFARVRRRHGDASGTKNDSLQQRRRFCPRGSGSFAGALLKLGLCLVPSLPVDDADVLTRV